MGLCISRDTYIVVLVYRLFFAYMISNHLFLAHATTYIHSKCNSTNHTIFLAYEREKKSDAFEILSDLKEALETLSKTSK